MRHTRYRQSMARRSSALEDGRVLPDFPLAEVAVRRRPLTRLHSEILDQASRVAIEESISLSDVLGSLILIGLAVRERSSALLSLSELTESQILETNQFLAGGK